MLINLSNHPSSTWSKDQLQTANAQFGEITDIRFPEINPECDETQIEELAQTYLQKIIELAQVNNALPVVHLMGEYCFCYKLVNMLKNEGVEVVVSTSKRHSVMNADGTKTIQFNFVRFRKY
jgi:hypothetical protein